MDSELYNAAMSGNVAFLRNYAPTRLISQKTPNDSSVLHIAAKFNRLDFFKEAIHLCPDKSLLKHVDSRGDTALHIAAKEGSPGVAKFIIGRAKNTELLQMLNQDGNNALHLAAQYGYFQVATLLVQADPKLAMYDNKAGQSACFLATVRGNKLMVDLLLGLKPQCSLCGDANGKTALHEAVFTSNVILKKILEARPEMIEKSDEIGWTPLHYAVACDKRVDEVKLILKRDRSAAYSVGNEGESALHIAAFNGCLNVIKLLVETYPDCWHLCNKKGQTALHAAVLGNNPEMVEYIIGLPGVAKSIAYLADEDGNMALHLAARLGNKAMIAILCKGKKSSERTVLLNATNKQNLTVLDIYEDEVEEDLRIALGEAIGFQNVHERAMYRINKTMKDAHRLQQLTRIIRQEKDSSEEDSFEHEFATSGEEFKLVEVTATLIAAVTFTAGFTLTGGQNEEGMAVLASHKAFQAFVIFDIIAFFYSIMVVLYRFDFNRDTEDRVPFEVHFTIAFLCMGLAFGCGMHVVLVRCGGFASVPLILTAILSFALFQVLSEYWYIGGAMPRAALRYLGRSLCCPTN